MCHICLIQASCHQLFSRLANQSHSPLHDCGSSPREAGETRGQWWGRNGCLLFRWGPWLEQDIWALCDDTLRWHRGSACAGALPYSRQLTWFLVLLRKRRATEMENYWKYNRKQNTTWCHGISWPGWQGSITVSVFSANSAIRVLISNSFVSRESWHISENQHLLLQHQSRI